MKGILFCLIVMFVFSRPAISYAMDVKPASGIENGQHTSFSDQEGLQKSTGGNFCNDVSDLVGDETNEPEDENCSAVTERSEPLHSGAYNFYNAYLKSIRYTGNFFPQHSSFFIFHSVFRL